MSIRVNNVRETVGSSAIMLFTETLLIGLITAKFCCVVRGI